MKADDRELLHLLRKELAALEAGEYRHPQTAAWRPAMLFQDSPLCPNHSPRGPRKPCSACPLARFIPLRWHADANACHQIRLTPDGQTLFYLYRWGTNEELEHTLGNWLRRAIYRLEWEVEVKERFLKPAALETRDALPAERAG